MFNKTSKLNSDGVALSTGLFSGPIVGLGYQTPTVSGVTGENGEFHYRKGERVAFLVGKVVLGTVMGAERVNVAELVSRVDGNIQKLQDPILTNVARFLQTLDQDGDVSNGITLTPEIHAIVGNRPIKFSPDVGPVMRDLGDPVAYFSEDPVIVSLLEDLNRSNVFTANSPRRLRSAAAARNEVRRNALGILRFKDVKIPLRNGSFVYADVFRPAKPGSFPAVMNCGVYGRAFVHHSIDSEADAERHELMEERYFFGNPDGYMYENHETVNTATWVPRDYAVVRVDTPGIGNSPGTIGIFGIDEAEAFRDAIEWAGEQPWCNGNVGLYGMSYYAMNQYNVASLQPRHLKAIVSIGTDTNSYDETLYQGGLFSGQFLLSWWNSQVLPAVCGEVKSHDFLAIASAHPFNEPDNTNIYGPRAKVFMSPDISQVNVPQWVVAATTHAAHVHQIGSSETYIASPAKHKKLDFWEDWFVKSYSDAAVEDHMAFFDYWLKGVENGIMDKPPVRLDIRTGNGSYYVQEENEWPIARTQYTCLYLDASTADWQGDGRRQDFLRMSTTPPEQNKNASYSAQVDLASIFPRCPWNTGVSFISDPVSEVLVLAGYMKAVLWVSSSSHDMDLYVSVRVIDENDCEVDYVGPMVIAKDPNDVSPLGKGWLKVSHRKLDPIRTTEYRPKHTHLRADYAPLKEDEVVQVEVEITPNTAVVRVGQRIRVDIQPYGGSGHGMPHAYDSSYHAGATNMIHTGPDYPSYVQLPVVPEKPTTRG